MQFLIRPFHELSVAELYRIYGLRSAVFVVEQACPYQDPDDKDPQAYHVMLLDGAALAAYARILPPGLSYPEPSIGRVVVAKQYREAGWGRQLMLYCMDKTLQLFNHRNIAISAQAYLLKFYTSLGFEASGDPYLEDNIPHVHMRYQAKAND